MFTRNHRRRGTVILAAVLSLPVFFAGCVANPVVDTEELRPDSPIEAAMFRYQQRLSEDGRIPDNSLMRAKRQRDALVSRYREEIRAGISPESWTWLGPGNIGGRIRPIVIHPDDPDTMWIGSASGGIWKTTDGGQNWFVLDDFMASLAVADLVMHPTNPDVLFAGTGEGFFEVPEGSSNTAAVRGAGIFKSIDGGPTWQQMPSTANPDFYFVNRLALHPDNPQIIVAATGTGIMRSSNGGAAWSRRAAFNALDVKFNPFDPTELVAGGHHADDGPYFSTDGGLTWQQAAGAGGHRQEMAYAPGNPDMVYAAVSGDNGRIRIWRSTDGGRNYILMTSGGGISTYAAYNNTIWVDPTNHNLLIVGGIYLHRSTNGGTTFQNVFANVHADMHRVVNHPDFDGVNNTTVFFATDGGIYKTTNVYGNSAFDLNNNLGITQFYGAAINPDTGHVAGGTQDNGSLSFQGDPQNWRHYFGGDGGYGAADPTDPNYFYGEVQRARIHRSTNGGQSGNYIYSGISDAGTNATNFIPYFTLDPNDPNRMLVCAMRLWRSNNVKASQPSWSVIKQAIDGGAPQPPPRLATDHFAPNDPRNISTVAVAPGNSDIIWVGHNNGQIWMTTNGTSQNPAWTRVDERGGNVLPDRWIARFAINPRDNNHVYVAFMGWEQDNIWKTEDAGQTWMNISGSGGDAIPAAPASALAIHQTKPGWVYVGTDIGVFTSNNDGLTWTAATEGPGTVPVEELIWKDGNTLMAVTHGRGIFLAEVVPPAAIDDVSIVTGSILDGDAGALPDSDDVYLRTESGFGRTLQDVHHMELLISATTGVDAPDSIEITVESRLDQPAGTEELRLRNRATGRLDLIDRHAIGSADQSITIDDIDAADYVNANGEVELSIKHIVVVPFLAFTFESFIDHVEVLVE